MSNVIEPGPVSADLKAWTEASITEVPATGGRHTMHSYYVACPESPDGTRVLYYSSGAENGETGDLRVLDRASGEERVIAGNIHVEDAHRSACQQWIDGGRSAVYHDCREGRWHVVAVDIETGRERVLAQDRQIGFGSPIGKWVPVYGCHWNPGPHRDLELIHIDTGEIRAAVTIAETIEKYGDWTREKFGTDDLAVFFPVMSPDGNRVIFKVSHPSYSNEFRSWQASTREGMVCYDFPEGRFVGLETSWGHPSWHPDSRRVCQKGNYLIDFETGAEPPFSVKSPSDHPSVTTNGNIFVTDADIHWRDYGWAGQWALFMGSVNDGTMLKLHQFDNAGGAATWRRNHPHPVFNASGTRCYFNTNSGPWTRLNVVSRVS